MTTAAVFPATPAPGDSPIRIRYMGNKHELAAEVRELVGEFRTDRPFLDLFCGMCSVGAAIAPTGRAVWGNDVQWAAATVARCLLTTTDAPLAADSLAEALRHDYERNLGSLLARFPSAAARERRLLDQPDVAAFAAEYARWRHAGNSAARRRETDALALTPTTPYRLFTLTFAWGYFGLFQAAQIDSIRYAIDRARSRRELTSDQARSALLALMQAVSCVASAPGHFAQYLGAKTDGGLARVAAQRRRDVWRQFLAEAMVIRPLGTSEWRATNHVMRRDALGIWPELRRRGYANGVIYADPPYSKDHYSRYYHVLDTLVRYDYPRAVGKGRYRPDRFVTPFSLQASVAASFDRLAKGVARTESALILSYPSNGLLSNCKDVELGALLRRHFGSVSLALRKPTVHSTLGARHGQQTRDVEELVYVARPAP